MQLGKLGARGGFGSGGSLAGAWQPLGSIFRMMARIDSLTAGAPTYSYFTLPTDGVADKTKARKGNAGMFVWADNGSPGYFQSGVGTGGPMSGIADWSVAPKSHSQCGKGTAFIGATSGQVNLDPGFAWTKAKVFFELASAGSSFNIGQANSAQTGNVNQQAVNDGAYPVGSLQTLEIVRDGVASTSTRIRTVNISGNANIFAMEFLTGNNGVITIQSGVGSTTLAQHASLDDGFARQWHAKIGTDIDLINGGMNDRATPGMTLDIVGTNMRTLVGRSQSNGKTRVTIIRSNDPQDAGTTLIKDYGPLWQTIAAEKGCRYFSVLGIPGFETFAIANAAGNMADLVHPSTPAGNALIAANIDAFLVSAYGA